MFAVDPRSAGQADVQRPAQAAHGRGVLVAGGRGARGGWTNEGEPRPSSQIPMFDFEKVFVSRFRQRQRMI